MKKHNFYPGPSILPQTVFQEAAKGVLNFKGTGLSILEISHRSQEFQAILHEAESLVRELLDINEEYGVIFLTGGASSQFYMVPMNLLDQDQKAGFLDTGAWSAKAIKETKTFGEIQIVASSKKEEYRFVPKSYSIPTDLAYFHLTSNNTIFGTQLKEWPETDVPFVCDMSSDIFTRSFPLQRFDLIYAGAQKNLGPAGTTLVIVKKERLGKIQRQIPSMLDYQNHIARNSAFNTPPVFAIYMSLLNLRWLKKQGGVPAMKAINTAKAEMLYSELDQNPCFQGTVSSDDRSTINATFRMAKGYEALEDEFFDSCTEANCIGLKGHRSVGGFRASMYNALDIDSVETLVGVMQSFAQRRG